MQSVGEDERRHVGKGVQGGSSGTTLAQPVEASRSLGKERIRRCLSSSFQDICKIPFSHDMYCNMDLLCSEMHFLHLHSAAANH